MTFFRYLVPARNSRALNTARNPVQYLDATTKKAFGPKSTPKDIFGRLQAAKKILVPVHGYQPQAWLYAEPFEDGQFPPYGNYGAEKFCETALASLRQVAGGSLGDDYFTVFPIWASNELRYVSTVRENARMAGEQFGRDLASLQEQFPEKEIEILAHSAGGLVTMRALVELAKSRSARLDKIRQTLLNVDVPSDAFTKGETGDVIEKLYGTTLLHDPGDRALLVAQIFSQHHPLDEFFEDDNSGLPPKVLKDIERENTDRKTAGREGLSGATPKNVVSNRIDLPDLLKHTGHTDLDWLETHADGRTQDAIQDALEAILQPHK